MHSQAEKVWLPIHLKVALGLIIALILASCFSRQLNGTGWDFQAYYKAAGRLLQGNTPYLYERDFSYKYAPIASVPFTVFHLFSYDIARWIYAALHAIIAIVSPYLLFKILERDPRLKIKQRAETYCFGILISFLGTFRFLDSEFHVSQVGLWITVTLLLGTLSLTRLPKRIWNSRLGILLLALGAIVKIHTLTIFSMFLKKNSPKTYLWAFGILGVTILLPNPLWWMDWYRHMNRSQFDLPMDMSSVNLQGIYSFAVLKLGMDQFSIWPLTLAIPLLLFAFIKLPRFSLEEIPLKPHSFLLTLCSWVLLSYLISPLPWQYTYSIAWVIVPLLWITSERIERRFIVGIALFLGLSPQGIIGKAASVWLEQQQSIFFAMLLIWILLLRQTLRVARSANSPEQA